MGVISSDCLWVAAVILALLGGVFYSDLKSIDEVGADHCSLLRADDFDFEDLDLDGSLLFGSADQRALHDFEKPLIAGLASKNQGGIFTVNLSAPELQLRRVALESFPSSDFHPHGIALYRGADGVLSLFVVNHRRDFDFVEVFDWLPLTHSLRYRASVGPFGPLNDVAVVSSSEFYVTQWLSSEKNTPLFFVEAFTRRPWSSVHACSISSTGNNNSTQACHVAADNIAVANGIALSKDGQRAFISGSLDNQVHVFKRDLANGKLTALGSVDVDLMPDNLWIDTASNDIYVAGSSQFWHTFAHLMYDHALRGSSRVVRIKSDSSVSPSKWTSETVYFQNGTLLTAASVAVRVQHEAHSYLALGAPFDRGVLFCRT